MTNTVKKYLAVGVAAAFVFGIFGYAIGTYGEDQAVTSWHPGSTATVQAVAPVVQPPAVPVRTQREAAFIMLMNGRPTMAAMGYSDDAWLALGHWVCTDAARGVTIGQAAQALRLQRGFSEFDAGYLYGGSIAAFCPQYEFKIHPQYGSTSGI